ncbi:MAG: oxygenase MpaB family protein [Actinomycetota bacterium]
MARIAVPGARELERELGRLVAGTGAPAFVTARLADLRASLGSALVRRVGGPDAVAHREEVLGATGEPWFAEDSPVRTVHADPAMFVGGLLAVFRQSLHPLAMAGVAEHSTYREDPWGRLHRTGRFLGTVTFGTRDAAGRAITQVRRIHTKVVGVAPDGRPYAASDPHLLLWVHIVEVASFITAHRRYGAERLDDRAYDRYVDEMAEVAHALGSDPAPHNLDELAQALRGFGPELRATREARRAAHYLLVPPDLSLAERVAYAPFTAAAVGLLPVDARIGLRLPILPVTDRLVVPPITGGMMRAARWVAA